MKIKTSLCALLAGFFISPAHASTTRYELPTEVESPMVKDLMKRI